MASGPSIAVKFLADTSNLVSGVDKAAGTASSSIGGFAKKAGVAIGGAFAVGAVVEFGKASVDAAAADAEGQAKLAQTLKNTTGATQDQIDASEKFIGSLSKQTAIADDDLRPAFDNLVRGFGNAEDAQKALALATDISAGTGKDLGSVSEALMKAANGQTGALGRLGIETKDSAGHAKTLDQIMGDLSGTFKGQAAAAAETTAGKMRNASIQFGEFQEQIGTAVLPVLGTMASFLTGTLIPALSGVADWISGHKDIIVAALIGVGVVVGTLVIPAFLSWAAAAGAAALATVLAAAPFIAIGAVIAGVALLIINNWDTIKAAAEATWDFVVGVIRGV
ncbi:MAG TPA: hypothetical protein VNN79_11455, partial [Actinomycetota bacterium]|nr:hypothetical protein [Actinomycetota bacterium]